MLNLGDRVASNGMLLISDYYGVVPLSWGAYPLSAYWMHILGAYILGAYIKCRQK